LLLKKGGHVVYHGPLGNNCSTIVSYFESRGLPAISLGENPANWMLRVITADDQNGLAEEYLHSKNFNDLKSELESLKENPKESLHVTFDSEFARSGARRRELINRRLRAIYWRSPTYNLARVIVSLVIAGVLGSVFIFRRHLEIFSEVDIQARLSVVFVSFIITGIMAILSVLPVMTKIRDMFYRHRDAGMYDSYSIGLALGVAEKGFIVASSALFCVVFLASSGLSDNVRNSIAFWVSNRNNHCQQTQHLNLIINALLHSTGILYI
jgi:ABC-2 type transporter